MPSLPISRPDSDFFIAQMKHEAAALCASLSPLPISRPDSVFFIAQMKHETVARDAEPLAQHIVQLEGEVSEEPSKATGTISDRPVQGSGLVVGTPPVSVTLRVVWSTVFLATVLAAIAVTVQDIVQLEGKVSEEPSSAISTISDRLVQNSELGVGTPTVSVTLLFSLVVWASAFLATVLATVIGFELSQLEANLRRYNGGKDLDAWTLLAARKEECTKRSEPFRAWAMGQVLASSAKLRTVACACHTFQGLDRCLAYFYIFCKALR